MNSMERRKEKAVTQRSRFLSALSSGEVNFTAVRRPSRKKNSSIEQIIHVSEVFLSWFCGKA